MFKEQCNGNAHISLSTTRKPKRKKKANSVNRKLDVVSWRGILLALFFASSENTRKKYPKTVLFISLLMPWSLLICSMSQTEKADRFFPLQNKHHFPLFLSTRTWASLELWRNSACQHLGWKWVSTGWVFRTQSTPLPRILAWRYGHPLEHLLKLLRKKTLFSAH